MITPLPWHTSQRIVVPLDSWPWPLLGGYLVRPAKPANSLWLLVASREMKNPPDEGGRWRTLRY